MTLGFSVSLSHCCLNSFPLLPSPFPFPPTPLFLCVPSWFPPSPFQRRQQDFPVTGYILWPKVSACPSASVRPPPSPPFPTLSFFLSLHILWWFIDSPSQVLWPQSPLMKCSSWKDPCDSQMAKASQREAHSHAFSSGVLGNRYYTKASPLVNVQQWGGFLQGLQSNPSSSPGEPFKS